MPKALLDEVFQPIVGMESPFRYRNKAQYPIRRDKSGKIIAGFYAGRTHDVIACDDCLLGVEENKAILNAIVRWMEDYSIDPYDEKSGEGLVRHVLCRKGFRSGQHMVCLVINGTSLPHQDALVEKLSPHVDSLSFSVNMENTNVIMGTKIVHLYGPGYIEDSIGEVRFRISPLSFYQVNPVQTAVLYGLAVEAAQLTGREVVLDAYCGIGTIGLTAADRAKQVVGVELNRDAVRDAIGNAKHNGVKNARFFAADATAWICEAAAAGERADVIFMDPPREGSTPQFIESVARMAPRRVVYVSCNPETMARDLALLTKKGYRAEGFTPVDMFPNSEHIEVVCALSRQKR